MSGQDNLLFPSIKYSKRLRESLHFNDLMNYLNSKETSNVLSWINNLKGYLKNYMQVVESELDFKKKNEKFCFDLNYIIDVILDRFLKARRLDGNVKFYHNTQVNSKEVLNGNNALNCKRDIYNDITNFKKLRRMFYNFCEDSSYIKDNFSLIKSLGKCEAYLPDIQNRKRILTKLLRRRGHSSPELFNYSKECNLNNLGNFLNTMNCNPENSEKEEGSQHEKGMQLNDQVSRPDPETATVSEQGEVDGDLPADTKELMDLEKNQDEEEFNLNTTYSAASLLGTSVVLYFLSRARLFGSWIQSKNQRRSKIVPMRNNGETDEWHLNNFHTEPINSELNEYHMPYNAIGEI